MDSRERDELRRLQERLYGPSADLQPDEGAAERLRQLMGRPLDDDLSPDRTRPEPPLVVPRDDVGRDQEDEDDVEDNRDEHELGAPDDAPPSTISRWRPSRPVAILWVCSLVLAILITIAATSALLPERLRGNPLAGSSAPIAILEVDPDFEVPGIFFSSGEETEATGFEEFSGVRPIVATGGFGYSEGSEDQLCLTIVISADLGTAAEYSFEGTLFEGCSANTFPASVQFMVTEEMPAELRDVFPSGTALRFDYDEENQDVVVSSSDG